MNFEEWMDSVRKQTEAALEFRLPATNKLPKRLHDAMRYAVTGGGKRMRPLLCHAAGSLFDVSPATLAAPACAVELIHAYSLVHDDLPAMDNDVLRRGKPTCHIEFDEATALLVGDALQALAFETLAQPLDQVDPARQIEMLRLLAEAAGSNGMAGGQAFDLQSVGRELDLIELEFMHVLKTGALIKAAVLLGAHAGGAHAEALHCLGRFANRAGLLFQVIDDILDAVADTATLGKTAGKDAANSKPTYVTLLGLARARELAVQLHHEARAALQPFDERAARLLELTDYIVDREF